MQSGEIREELWWVAEMLHCDPSAVRLDQPFGELGLDSLQALDLVGKVAAVAGRDVDEDVLSEVVTPADAIGYLAAAPR